MKAVYTIGILNFSFPDAAGRDRYVREIQLLDKHTFEVFYDKLTFIYLEMPRFRKREAELLTHFDKWMYVLKHLHRLREKPEWLQGKIFEKLFSEAALANLTPEDMNRYEESLKVYRDNKNAMDYAVKVAAQEAMQQGMQQGRLAERIEVAREMKAMNMPVELIRDITKLSREEFEEL